MKHIREIGRAVLTGMGVGLLAGGLWLAVSVMPKPAVLALGAGIGALVMALMANSGRHSRAEELQELQEQNARLRRVLDDERAERRHHQARALSAETRLDRKRCPDDRETRCIARAINARCVTIAELQTLRAAEDAAEGRWAEA